MGIKNEKSEDVSPPQDDLALSKKPCRYCARPIPSISLELHEVHCQRNLKKCSLCDDVVPVSQMQQHVSEDHALVCCPYCKKRCDKIMMEKHQEYDCAERPSTCKYCEIVMPLSCLPDHIDMCGSKTDHCSDCGKYVQLQHWGLHKESGHNLITPSEKNMDNGREIPHFLHLPDKLQECVTSKNDQIPCEKCCKLFPTHEITIHQATCGMNSFAPLLPSVLSLVGRTCEILYHSAQGRNHINEDLFPSERDRLWNNFKSNARDSPIDDAIRSRPAAMLPSEILASEARAAESNIQEVEDAQKLHVDCQYCGIEVLLEDLEIHEGECETAMLDEIQLNDTPNDLKDIPRGMHAFELGGGHPYSEGHGGAKPKVHKILPKPEYETLNRQDEGGSNVEMMECEVIPCEFCSQLIPFNDLILHSTGCQPQHFQGTLGDEELHRDFRGYFGSPPSAERYTGTVGSKCPKRSTPLAKTLNTIHDGKAPHGNSKARVSKHNALLVIQPEEPLASLLDISRPLQGHRYQAPGGCDTRSPQQDRENLLEIEELRCLVGNTEAYFRSKSEGEKIQH